MDEMLDPEERLKRIDAQMGGSKPEDEPEDVPPVTTLVLDCEGSRGKRYSGRFYYKVPTIGDMLRIAQLKASFLPNGAGGDINGTALSDTIAYLTVCIRFDDQHPKPHWWKPMSAFDPTPYLKLYQEALAYEDRFHGRNQDDGDHQEGLGADEDDGGADGESSPRVGRKVPPPAQRRETLAGDGA